MMGAFRRDTVLCYWVASPPEWCIAMGEGCPWFERVVFVGDDEPSAVGPEQLTVVCHCPGLLDEMNARTIEAWSSGHAAGRMNNTTEEI